LDIFVSLGKESFLNKKSSSQKTINNKIYIAPFDLFFLCFPELWWLKILIKYRTIHFKISGKSLALSNTRIESYAY